MRARDSEIAEPYRRPWYRDRQARSLILFRYLPWLAVLSLGWEIAQLPLYTLWKQATPAYMGFAVAHCTVGDVLIGALALMLSLQMTRAHSPEQWRRARIAVLTVIAAVSYTALSEWLNTVALRSWEYSSLMPRIRLGEIEPGLSPLAQWLVIPPLALWLAFRLPRRASSKWIGG
ncbi:MAG TPA: hypothetical protein VN929_13225 [Burkholderiales bacterium]|nr:hypothetical protein [Burkholderiales bacterium]